MIADIVTDSIGLGSFVLAVPLSVVAFYQIRAYHDAKEIKRKQAENDRLTRLIEQYVRPSNGRTTAKVVEDTSTLLEEIDVKLTAHINDQAAHNGGRRH